MATTLEQELAEERRIINAATDGPLKIDGPAQAGPYDTLILYPPSGGVVAYVQPSWDDAERLAHSWNALPQRNAQLRAVLKLHPRESMEETYADCAYGDCDCDEGEHPKKTVDACGKCIADPELGGHELWPCPTVRAIEEADNG